MKTKKKDISPLTKIIDVSFFNLLIGIGGLFLISIGVLTMIVSLKDILTPSKVNIVFYLFLVVVFLFLLSIINLIRSKYKMDKIINEYNKYNKL